ncbi:hypothetical protein CsatB_012917 [Cannabis sativa]|uniref:Uncharacterized protein n=1 Tax=Cannabis sativa TaxID=3483 RepID=A0A7J6HY09_CANSA|nr:uncharacterized protein LOC115705365 [Cannabis sativa]KAF4399739.1 hypothetical protein G4B88_022822 [Cannabis sativa]
MKNSNGNYMPPVRHYYGPINPNEIRSSEKVRGYTTNNNTTSFNGAEKKETTSSSNYKLESKASMDINESADAFIKKFRQQLLIQRLDSIDNYHQMLARGL